MERELAKVVATKATMKDAIKTLQNAYSKTRDWTVRSEVNRGFTKGTAFNILIKSLFSLKENHAIKKEDFYTFRDNWQFKDLIEKVIWEFGEFYPDVEELTREWQIKGMSHQEPIEVDWSELTEEEPETQRIK